MGLKRGPSPKTGDRANLEEKRLVNLTINLPDEDVAALKAKAMARGVSAEQYALQVLEQDLAPEWLRKSWVSAKEAGVHQLSVDEIDAEIAAARKARREANPQPGE
jgi:plasmid stability protein